MPARKRVKREIHITVMYNGEVIKAVAVTGHNAATQRGSELLKEFPGSQVFLTTELTE